MEGEDRDNANASRETSLNSAELVAEDALHLGEDNKVLPKTSNESSLNSAKLVDGTTFQLEREENTIEPNTCDDKDLHSEKTYSSSASQEQCSEEDELELSLKLSDNECDRNSSSDNSSDNFVSMSCLEENDSCKEHLGTVARDAEKIVPLVSGRSCGVQCYISCSSESVSIQCDGPAMEDKGIQCDGPAMEDNGIQCDRPAMEDNGIQCDVNIIASSSDNPCLLTGQCISEGIQCNSENMLVPELSIVSNEEIQQETPGGCVFVSLLPPLQEEVHIVNVVNNSQDTFVCESLCGNDVASWCSRCRKFLDECCCSVTRENGSAVTCCGSNTKDRVSNVNKEDNVNKGVKEKCSEIDTNLTREDSPEALLLGMNTIVKEKESTCSKLQQNDKFNGKEKKVIDSEKETEDATSRNESVMLKVVGSKSRTRDSMLFNSLACVRTSSPESLEEDQDTQNQNQINDKEIEVIGSDEKDTELKKAHVTSHRDETAPPDVGKAKTRDRSVSAWFSSVACVRASSPESLEDVVENSNDSTCSKSGKKCGSKGEEVSRTVNLDSRRATRRGANKVSFSSKLVAEKKENRSRDVPREKQLGRKRNSQRRYRLLNRAKTVPSSSSETDEDVSKYRKRTPAWKKRRIDSSTESSYAKSPEDLQKDGARDECRSSPQKISGRNESVHSTPALTKQPICISAHFNSLAVMRSSSPESLDDEVVNDLVNSTPNSRLMQEKVVSADHCTKTLSVCQNKSNTLDSSPKGSKVIQEISSLAKSSQRSERKRGRRNCGSDCGDNLSDASWVSQQRDGDVLHGSLLSGSCLNKKTKLVGEKMRSPVHQTVERRKELEKPRALKDPSISIASIVPYDSTDGDSNGSKKETPTAREGSLSEDSSNSGRSKSNHSDSSSLPVRTKTSDTNPSTPVKKKKNSNLLGGAPVSDCDSESITDYCCDIWKPSNARDRKTHRLYTEKERMQIIKYIVKEHKYHLVKGVELWKQMEANQVCPGRSWQSMKEHFRKQILPRIETFQLSSDTVKRFKRTRK